MIIFGIMAAALFVYISALYIRRRRIKRRVWRVISAELDKSAEGKQAYKESAYFVGLGWLYATCKIQKPVAYKALFFNVQTGFIQFMDYKSGEYVFEPCLELIETAREQTMPDYTPGEFYETALADAGIIARKIR